jgi:hypothetical protein
MKRAIIVIATFVLVLIGAAVAFVVHVERVARPTRELSKMVSVRYITGEALCDYYKQHGSYPRSLSDLPLSTLNWGDEGSSPKDLEQWRYTSDGQTFTLSWTNASQGYEVFLGGNGKETLVFREDLLPEGR